MSQHPSEGLARLLGESGAEPAPHVGRFAQAGQSVELRATVPGVVEHAYGRLWAYSSFPGGSPPDCHVAVSVDGRLIEHGARLLRTSRESVEIGPSRHATVARLGSGGWMFWARDGEFLAHSTSGGTRTVVVCRDEATAVRYGYRLVRQLMTSRLLRQGAVYCHAAAARVRGRGVLICGPSGAGKSTVLMAALRHLGADFVSNDRVLLSPTGNVLTCHAWPDRMRLGLGTLAATPGLAGRVPAHLRGRSPRQLSGFREKVSIWPPDIPSVLRGGRLRSSCEPTLVLLPHLELGRRREAAARLAGGELRDALTATELFLRNRDGTTACRTNHWLFPRPAPADEERQRATVVRRLESQAQGYRLLCDARQHAIAQMVEKLLAE